MYCAVCCTRHHKISAVISTNNFKFHLKWTISLNCTNRWNLVDCWSECREHSLPNSLALCRILFHILFHSTTTTLVRQTKRMENFEQISVWYEVSQNKAKMKIKFLIFNFVWIYNINKYSRRTESVFTALHVHILLTYITVLFIGIVRRLLFRFTILSSNTQTHKHTHVSVSITRTDRKHTVSV